jgi:hypothetical protein
MSNYALKAGISSVIGIVGLLFSANTFAAEYAVEINKTEIMRLPGAAAAVVIGNPKIADISVHSNDTLLVNGRGYGETNIIVFDQFGETIMNADIVVNAPSNKNGVRVNFIGEGQETYTCSPYCRPSPVLGDTAKFISNFEGDTVASQNTTATGPSRSLPPSTQSAQQPTYNQDR